MNQSKTRLATLKQMNSYENVPHRKETSKKTNYLLVNSCIITRKTKTYPKRLSLLSSGRELAVRNYRRNAHSYSRLCCGKITTISYVGTNFIHRNFKLNANLQNLSKCQIRTAISRLYQYQNEMLTPTICGNSSLNCFKFRRRNLNFPPNFIEFPKSRGFKRLSEFGCTLPDTAFLFVSSAK